MATLEIHEVGRRVRRVRIGRSQPVMFGTNPLCDVALDDPSVKAFHGRIRWSKTRFKAEAVAEVPYIEVNGRKVKSKGLRQGDEIHVGHSRIFLLSVEDDGPDHGEKTVVQAPIAANDYPIEPVRSASPPPPEYHRMEMAAPSLEFSNDEVDEPATARPPRREASPPPLARSDWRKQAAPRTVFDDFEDVSSDDEESEPSTSTRSASTSQAQSWPSRVVAILRGVDRPPGEERVFTSPVVIGLAITFLLLVGLSFGLYRVIVRTEAQGRFTAATDSYERGDFVAAIKGFDAYLTAEPEGSRANKAKVYRSLARVRRHTSATSGSWNNAYKEAEAMLDDVSSLPEYRDVSVDLADEVRKTAEGMLDRARELADPAWLNQAQAAIALHSKIAGSAAASLMARSKVAEKLAQAQSAIRKVAEVKAAIAAIDASIGSNRPSDAYHARSSILRRYPDLASNKEIASRLGKINDLVRSAVRFDPSGRPGLTDPIGEPLGPPTSLVLRLDPSRPPARSGPPAYALADGWAWAFDAESGAPLWQVPVGLASPFAPVRVEGGLPTVLMIDARTSELVCREGRTGRLVWRQTLEGWATDPPLVQGSRVLQPMVDGRLLEIDLKSGDLRGTLKLGRKIARGPITNKTGEQAFLLADEDCLFVLGLDPLACASVEFLGHESGTVPCSPTRAGRLFVLAENQALDSGRWRVFVMSATGGSFRQVQEVAIGGWTWASPVESGPVFWSTSDRGEVIAFAIGRVDAKTPPLSPIARLAPSPLNQGPAYPQARSDREFTVASGLSARYDLDVDRGKLTPVWTLGAAGRALAPAQTLGKLTVLTQQPESGQGAALWGVDSASGDVRWRTIVGSPWPSRWRSAASGDSISSLLADGRDLTLTRDQLRSGGFVEQALPKPGSADVVSPGSVRLEVDGATILVPSPEASQILVRDSSGTYRTVALPAPPASSPLPVGKNLLIPGLDGRIYLIEPRSGLSVADPYIPPFDRSKAIRWRSPVALENEACVVADGEGTLRRLVVETNPRPRLVVSAERKLDSPAIVSPASTGSAILVVTADLKVRAFSGRDLSPLGSWPILTPPTFGPTVASGFGFVGDATGQVFAFSGEGRRLWTSTLREPRVAGPPVVRGDSAWFVTRDQGGVEALNLGDGASLGQTRLEIEPAAGPVSAENDLIIPTGVSTLQTFLPPNDPGASTGGSPR